MQKDDKAAYQALVGILRNIIRWGYDVCMGKMFKKIDKWLLEEAEQKNLNFEPAGSRWGFFNMLLSGGIFAFGWFMSFLALAISIRALNWSGTMWIAYTAFGIAMIGLLFAIYFFAYAIHVANLWRKEGSKDADSKNIEEIRKMVTEIHSVITECKKEGGLT
jgi:hypothetical protein